MNLILFTFSFFLFCGFQIKLFKTLLSLFPYDTRKQKAFYLSTLNSFVMSLSGIYFNFILFNFDSISLASQIIQILTISYFTSYLLCDLCIGVFYYNEYIQILTGYFHHSLYIFINIYAILTNNTFIYCLYMISEIPTFILSLGSLNNKLRMDKLFGFTFFILRIVYHSFIISLYFLPYHIFPITRFFNQDAKFLATVIGSGILGLHFHWFSNWYSKYFK